jgi:hypothetical protein
VTVMGVRVRLGQEPLATLDRCSTAMDPLRTTRELISTRGAVGEGDRRVLTLRRSVARSDRQGDREGRALAEQALDRDGAAVEFGGVPDD